jgi:hypothetical protein
MREPDVKIEEFGVKDFVLIGPYDAVGVMGDGRWFWAWNLGMDRELEELFLLGEIEDGSGGRFYDTHKELVKELEKIRPDLALSVKKLSW